MENIRRRPLRSGKGRRPGVAIYGFAVDPGFFHGRREHLVKPVRIHADGEFERTVPTGCYRDISHRGGGRRLRRQLSLIVLMPTMVVATTVVAAAAVAVAVVVAVVVVVVVVMMMMMMVVVAMMV